MILFSKEKVSISMFSGFQSRERCRFAKCFVRLELIIEHLGLRLVSLVAVER